MTEGSAFLSCWILVVVRLLGKYPAIFFGSRIYLVLKVWSKGMKIVGVFEGNDCDGTVKRALPPVHSVRRGVPSTGDAVGAAEAAAAWRLKGSLTQISLV